MNILDRAIAARREFVKKTKSEGESFWTLSDSAPDWVENLVKHAHDGMLPDDWKYEFIVDALDLIIDGEGATQDLQLDADIYTNKLLQWLSSSNYRVEYCNEAAEELGATVGDLIQNISIGQYKEKNEVLQRVIDSLESE